MLEIAFENCIFLVCYCHFWKDKSFLISADVDQPNSSSKAPHWKPLFLIKIKVKQNLGCQNEEYNPIFKHSYEDVRAYPSSKKIRNDKW